MKHDKEKMVCKTHTSPSKADNADNSGKRKGKRKGKRSGKRSY